MILLFILFCIQPCFSAARSKGNVQDSALDVELKEFQLDDLNARLHTMEAGPERDYFAGVVANRENRITESIRLLSRALPSLRQSNLQRTAIAVRTLQDDYRKNFQYAAAARLSDDPKSDDDVLLQILRNTPPQTITWNGPVRLTTERNPLNSTNVELTVNGVKGPWLLDTGANDSVVSKSFAEKLGLKLLPGAGQTQGMTGIENPQRVAVLPTLQMGGATLHNVVVLVLNDTSLNVGFGKKKYQINGIIGYPVFQALGSITFLHGGEFVAGERPNIQGTGARMYMQYMSPVIECNVEGNNLPFSVDTGAEGTNLFVRYYDRFRGESKTLHWKKGKNKTFGAGGFMKRKIYLQPRVALGIGDKTAILKNLGIYLSGTGGDADDLYGTLGQDLVSNFASFTLDFKAMTFSLGKSLNSDERN